MADEVKSNGLMVIKLENQKIPVFKQEKGKDWVLWGEDNDYPDYLIELFMRSSTHNAIVTGKVNYILGNGWVANKKGLTVNEEAILENFVRKINPDETLNELSEKISLDFELFNALAFEVVFSKSGKDFYLYHMPINKLRTNEDRSKFFYSRDWTKSVRQDPEKTGFKEYKPFDFDKKENGIFVYQITAPRKGKDPNVYPIQEYIGSCQAIETDAECSNYNLSEIKTGFSAGTILNFYNGIPEAEAKKEIEKKIKEKFSGTDRAGSFILNFADGKERGSEVTTLNGNDLDKRYMELKKDVRQEIFTGHKVSSPMLFGVKTEGQLGGRAEIAEAYELFQNTYISKRQRILEKIFNKFAALRGCKANLKLAPTSAINANVFSEDTMLKVLPLASIRDILAERMGIDLSKYENTPVTSTTQMSQTNFRAVEFEGILISRLSGIGRPKAKYEFIESREQFKKDLTPVDKSIIDLIGKNEKISVSDLAKALNTDAKTIQDKISKLVDSEYLSPVNDGYSPTASGEDVIASGEAKTADYEVMYSYELRSNAPALLPGGQSREFCKNLIKLDLLYTRQEIDDLSNEFGTDVWTFKGGWYTNPKTDAPTPQCRHIWVQHVVKRK
jgi:DNA-binding Lrp family transcriptional regulator